MNINQTSKPATYHKAKQGEELKVAKKQNLKAIAMLLGFLLFIGGAISVFLISQSQDTTPVAPNVPQSKPAAFIEKTQTCTLVFDVVEPEKLACGAEGCESDSDCDEDLICVTADDDKKYCADEKYLSACTADPDEDSCCSAPPTTITPTDEPTVTPTVTTTVTPTGTVTVTTTVTPTGTVTATVTPGVTTVITTVGCNDICQANADCANVSHICYQGQCRLDVNPTDAQCKLPSGETTIVRPVHVPTQSGPADWLNYLKAGLGVLGVGAMLLLLL